MTRTRFLVLTLGPPALIGAAYALSYPSLHGNEQAFTAHLVEAQARFARLRARESGELADACAAAADQLRAQLPVQYAVAIHPPFVLAGDISHDELDRVHRETVLPVTEALWRCYFDRRPDQPVTIVALRDEPSYRDAARLLDGYTPALYAGYTQRGQRRIVFNAGTGTGAGTLAHELAHVLALFDFPEMPEWFDEGLATLHEEATFSSDGLTLSGVENWRCRLLVEALRAGNLPKLETVLSTPTFRGEGEGLNYAVVRGLCLYLQERGILPHFYRKFRANVRNDPSGLTTLCELLGAAGSAEIERDFRAWIRTQSFASGPREATGPAWSTSASPQ